jgi:predicted enzyme involved in methoxymalonyl-ACP biosynthesis
VQGRAASQAFAPSDWRCRAVTDPANYVSCLSELNLFEAAGTSSLDHDRTATYREQARRESARPEFHNLDDYLQSLEMTATIARFDAFHLPRIAQLIQRSNQFNLTRGQTAYRSSRSLSPTTCRRPSVSR